MPSVESRARRRSLVAALLLGGVALALRSAFALVFGRTPLGRSLYLDSRVYDDLALALREGSGGALEPFFVEPLYGYFLAAAYGLFGREWLPVRLLQALGGAVVVGLVFDLACRLYGRRAGWAAGLAAALYGPLVFYDAMLLKTSLEVLLATLLLWLLVRGGGGREGRLAWLAAGLVLGLAAIVKANLLVLAPVAIAAALADPGRAASGGVGRRAWSGALWVALGIAAVTLPIVLRNSLLAGRPTFLTTGAGMNFYQGNRLGSDGGLDIPPFIQLDPSREQEDSIAEARRRSGRPTMSASEASGFWFAESWRSIRSDPGAWVRLLGRKALLFWNHYEAADNLGFHYTRSVVPWLWLAPLGFWLVAPLGLAATLAGAGGGRGEALLRSTVALIMLGTVLFHVADRYRLAAVPALIVLAVGFLRASVAAWRAGARGRVAGRAALVAATALLVNGPNFYPGGQDSAPFDRIMAQGLAARGETEAAAAYGERAGEKFYRRGRSHLERGEFYRAEIYFESALEVDPDRAGAWYHLGLALERLGRDQEAAPAYRRAVAADSFAAEALTRLGRLHLAAGRPADAERDLEEAARRAPEDLLVLVALGDLRAMQGRFGAALELFERARLADPQASWVEPRIEAARSRLAD